MTRRAIPLRTGRLPVWFPTGAEDLSMWQAMVLLVILSIVSVAAGIGLQSVIKAPTAADQIN